MTWGFTLPSGVDPGGLIDYLITYGAIIVPIVGFVGAFFLAVKIFKRA
jgi:hypothetical protein